MGIFPVSCLAQGKDIHFVTLRDRVFLSHFLFTVTSKIPGYAEEGERVFFLLLAQPPFKATPFIPHRKCLPLGRHRL